MSGLFPSRTVALYMARLFLVRVFAILAGMTLVLTMLAVLSESGKILAHPGNSEAEVWRYVSLRMPQIIAFATPYAVLLGTLVTFWQMNTNSEVIALKGGGMSAHQVLAPLLVASLGVAALSFAFNDRVVSRATGVLTQWQLVEYGPVPTDRGDRSNVWVLDGDDLIQADQVKGRGPAATLTGVTIYDRTGGRLVSIITAPRGVREGEGWRIFPARRFDVAADKQTLIPVLHVADGVRPDQFTLATVDPDSMSFGALRSAIGDLSDAGRPTKALEGSAWHKLSGPLSAVLMPLLGAVAAFGLARSGQLFVRAVIGMALGFAYFVADNFALAMGNLGAYPPFLAAWAPFLMFLLIGESVLVRTEE